VHLHLDQFLDRSWNELHKLAVGLLVDGNMGYSLYLGGPGLGFTWATNILRQHVSPSVSPITADFNNDGWQDIAAACVGRSSVSFSLGHSGGGSSYTVEFKDNLNGAGWSPMPASAGLGLELTAEVPLGTQRFFRVREH
jgi:hypothetical protein